VTEPLLWLLALGPLALAAVGLLPAVAGSTAAETARRAGLAGGFTLSLAVVALFVFASMGPLRTGTFGVAGIGLALTLDSLSGILFLLVAFVGLVVVRFSRNYMDGDPRHALFIRRLCLALAAVLAMILSGNLLQVILAWIATSVALDRLLLFYADRPAAVLAARKKWVVSRLGDACLLAAAVLCWTLFGSLDQAAVSSGAGSLAASGSVPWTAHAAAVLLVVAALLKSAQVPVHGWLLEVMETPTPVSALLHAGIINAGGFLLLRFADVVALSIPALDVLIVMGGLTALVGSVVMLTQTSIKVQLAWSTIAQMGFMMLQVGLGAFSAALLHIVAHSLYKAHAFLSSGSVVDLHRASWSPSPGGRPHPARLGLAIALMFAITLTVASLFGVSPVEKPGVFALGAIVLLGLTSLIVNAVDERPTGYVIARTLVVAVGVSVIYFALQWAAAAVTTDALPPVQSLRGAFDLVVILIVVGGFATITLLQILLPAHAGEPRWQALHAHVSNGFYVNTLANRLAIRLWPAPAPRPAAHRGG
jgi:NAD(P)H-quinone oxidoreductase subunit 5